VPCFGKYEQFQEKGFKNRYVGVAHGSPKKPAYVKSLSLLWYSFGHCNVNPLKSKAAADVAEDRQALHRPVTAWWRFCPGDDTKSVTRVEKTKSDFWTVAMCESCAGTETNS